MKASFILFFFFLNECLISFSVEVIKLAAAAVGFQMTIFRRVTHSESGVSRQEQAPKKEQEASVGSVGQHPHLMEQISNKVEIARPPHPKTSHYVCPTMSDVHVGS